MMNANKAAFFLCAALGLFLSQEARAAGSAPALLGIQEVLVRQAHLGNGPASDSCGLSGSEAANEVVKRLREDQVPAYPLMKAPTHKEPVARVELLPEIATLQHQGLDCVSWISLMAETREAVAVPPLDIARNVSVVYWRGGLLVSSAQTMHARAVYDALAKLASSFAQRYKVDQPPPLPDFEE